MKRLLLVLLALCAAAVAQQGIPGTLVQQSPTMLNACTVITKNGGINTAITTTITPPASQFVYICAIDLTLSNDATGTGVSTNLSWTSTNLGAWSYQFSQVGTANTTPIDKNFYFTFPVKSANAGTAVTLVSPAVNAHAAYNQNVYYYFAP
jgi:hypothetical protein